MTVKKSITVGIGVYIDLNVIDGAIDGAVDRGFQCAILTSRYARDLHCQRVKFWVDFKNDRQKIYNRRHRCLHRPQRHRLRHRWRSDRGFQCVILTSRYARDLHCPRVKFYVDFKNDIQKICTRRHRCLHRHQRHQWHYRLSRRSRFSTCTINVALLTATHF